MKYVVHNLQFCWGADTENVYIWQATATEKNRNRITARLNSENILPVYAKDAR